VIEDQEVVIVRRRGSPDVALIPAEELASLMEIAHQLRSPANAKRLLSAQRRTGRERTSHRLRTERRKRIPVYNSRVQVEELAVWCAFITGASLKIDGGFDA
jgi:PHD/YefM family antitoxin component YafN of YafNO toxin-antitoxin module